MNKLANYALVTLAYWGFTLTDGALRMLVLLHFYQLGYNPFEIALLFLLYEFFGVVTNLVGGWIGARLGLRVTLFGGLTLQVLALFMLAALDPEWQPIMSIAWVMASQGLSGIAKDLTKMSAKSAVRLLVPKEANNALFKWVAILTGSKNTLKGVGFFLGGLLLATVGFKVALVSMAVTLTVLLILIILTLPADMGDIRTRIKFRQILSKSPEINALSAARFFLFGARDLWFVVGLPLFLAASLGWGHVQVSSYMALWVIAYGLVQAAVPAFLRNKAQAPGGPAARRAVFVLGLVTLGIVLGLTAGLAPGLTVIIGLAVFGIVFAVNSALHSYLILAYSEDHDAALNVGFYYMANAGGRLVGTLCSGLAYQAGGLQACLWASAIFIALAWLLSFRLPQMH